MPDSLTRPGWARHCVALLFFVNGALFASWGSRIPTLAAARDMGPGALAIAVLGLSVGSVLGLPLSGALVVRFGSVPVVRLSLVGYAAALAGVGTAPTSQWLTVALVGLGVGNGMVDVAMNTAAVAVERHYPRQIMAAFHAQFSFGGLAGALLGAGAAALDVAPGVHLPLAAVALLVGGLWASRGLLPDAPDRTAEAGSGERRRVSRDPRLLALGALALSSLLCEGAVYDWSAVYLRDTLGADPATAALGFAAFTLAMACGRLVADRIAHRIGAVTYVRGGGLLTVLGLGLALVSTPPAGAVLGFGLLGWALSGVVPTLFSAAAHGRTTPAPALSVVSTIGYLGFLAGPALIGGVASAASLRWALAVLLVPALVVLVGAGALRTPPTGQRTRRALRRERKGGAE